MWLQGKCAPDAMNRRRRNTRRPSHVARAPMRRIRRFFFERFDDDRLDLIVSNLARRSATRLVRKAVEALLGEAVAPRPRRLPRHADASGDLAVVRALSRQKHNLRTLRLRPRNLATTRQTLKRLALFLAKLD